MSWSDARVTVCRLDGDPEGGSFETSSYWKFGSEPAQLLDSEKAREAEQLWEALPDGETARCHMPRFGLEVHAGERMDLRAAFCFECSNISIRTPDGDDTRGFDPRSKPARSLLKLFESVL